MAFMMPVMKNNYDIYKDGRSRKTSESNTGGNNNVSTNPSVASAMGISSTRGRQRIKSESFASSPSHTVRMQMQRCQSQKTFPRNSSRTSQCSTTSGALSPTRSFCQTTASSPPKNNNSSNTQQSDSQNDMNKFHLRLVEKLRKSFRKDSAKRS